MLVMGECRDLKSGGQVDDIKSQPMNDKPSLKWVWSRHMSSFTILVPRKISLE